MLNLRINLGCRSWCCLARPSSDFASTVGLGLFNAQSILQIGSGSSVLLLHCVWWIKLPYTFKCRLQKCYGCLVTNSCSDSVWTFLEQFFSLFSISVDFFSTLTYYVTYMMMNPSSYYFDKEYFVGCRSFHSDRFMATSFMWWRIALSTSVRTTSPVRAYSHIFIYNCVCVMFFFFSL